MAKDLKDELWEMVMCLVDDAYHDKVCREKHDDDIENLKDCVESLAQDIESRIDEEYNNAEPDAHDDRRGHNLV